MKFVIGTVRKEFYSRVLELIDHARQIEKLRHQPEEVVNQNGDINERKRRGIFLYIFNTPFWQWVLPKSITHD